MQGIDGPAMPDQEIDVFAVDGEAAGKKAQSQLIVVNGMSRLLNGIDGLQVQAFSFHRLLLAVSNSRKSGFGLPAQRSIRTGSGKDTVKELIRIAESLFGGCNVASQDQGIGNAKRVSTRIFYFL